MKQTKLDLIVVFLVGLISIAAASTIIFGAGNLIVSSAHAATTWTLQPERYHTYNSTPTKAKETLVRVKTTEIEGINPAWKKLDGVFMKEISSGGSVRYPKELVTVPPVVDECKAQFVCHPDWGWIVNIDQNQVNKCTAIKITKDQAAIFDSVLSTNGGTDTACPVYPKP